MAVTVHEAVATADAISEQAGLDGFVDILDLALPVLEPLLFIESELVDGVQDKGVQHLAVIGHLHADAGLADDGVLAEGVDGVVIGLDQPFSGLVDDPAFPFRIGDDTVSVIEDKLGEGIAVKREAEVDDDLSIVVDEADVSVLLDGGQPLRKDPGAAVLCRDGDFARIHVIVSALVLGAEDCQGVVAGALGPVDLDVLDGDDAGGGVLDGDLAVFGAIGDEVVVQEQPFVRDVFDDFGLVAGGAAGDGGEDDGHCDDEPGEDVEDVIRSFHFRGVLRFSDAKIHNSDGFGKLFSGRCMRAKRTV